MAQTMEADLDRLLLRLERTLLSPTGDDSNLRATSLERTRTGANIEYARTLLLQLEHTTQDIKTDSRRASLQASLQTKRDLIKRLNQRLIELDSLADDTEDDDDDSSSDEEQDATTRVKEFAPAVPTHDTLDTEDTTPNTLRSRKQQQPFISTAAPDAATTTALFGNRTPANPTAAPNPPASTETILDDSRREQDLLTTSLVSLAQSLKQSSQQFASSLEEEKEVLRRAESGLDKNAMGMEAAGGRMNVLKRMTEGQGWWGRIKLYAIIAALWVAAFLLVFVGPKLRF